MISGLRDVKGILRCDACNIRSKHYRLEITTSQAYTHLEHQYIKSWLENVSGFRPARCQGYAVM